MRVLVTRSRADSEETARRLADRGIECDIEPLLSVAWLTPSEPLPDPVGAWAVTSRNGAEALDRLADDPVMRKRPVFAVGDRTAEVLRDAGFPDVRSADGDVEALASRIVGDLGNSSPKAIGEIIHVGGEETAGDLTGALHRGGLAARRIVAYRVHNPDTLTETTVSAIRSGLIDGVVHFSPRSAETFVRLAAKVGLGPALRNMDAFCISAAVRKKAEAGAWGRYFVAEWPTLDAVVDAVAEVGQQDG